MQVARVVEYSLLYCVVVIITMSAVEVFKATFPVAQRSERFKHNGTYVSTEAKVVINLTYN